MEAKDRIQAVISYAELTASEFADEIGVQRSSVSHITSGRNKPSLDFLVKVKERFPDLAWDWLITGQGEMRTNADAEPSAAKTERPTTPPDLFTLINDENFGKSENNEVRQTPRDFPIPASERRNANTADSQPFERQENNNISEDADNQSNKIKRVIIFYENGRFESFEP